MDVSLLRGSIARLLISLLMGFPFSIIYRIVFIKNKKGNEFQRNLYTFITGFIISLYFNGKDSYHPLVTLVGTYFIIQYIKNPKHITIASWVFNFGYLLISYYMYSSTDYDLNWLTPQSIICLRLIGVSMDYADGHKKKDENKKPSRTVYKGLVPPKEWAITEKPQLIELLGYCYFYGTSIVGPQFSFKRYKKFISFELFNTKDVSFEKDFEKLSNSSFKYSITHFLKGLLYSGLFLIISKYFYTSFLLTKEYGQFKFWKKIVYAYIAGKYVLFKYFGVWMLAEAQCIITMLEFDGINSEGNDYLWDAVDNVKPLQFQFAFTLDDIVTSYNIKTNMWGKQYVYKRFAFLGNKQISQLINLTFLSIWHGFHVGYPISFYYEYILFVMQSIFKYWFKPLNQYMAKNLETNTSMGFKIQYYIYHGICTLLTLGGISYPLIAFDLLTWNKIKMAYNNMYWIGHIIALVVVGSHLIYINMRSMLKPKKKVEKKTE